MANKTVGVTVSTSGAISSTGAQNVSDSTVVEGSKSPLAAQPAVLTTRGGNTTGSLTMTNSGHGIITGQRLDLYWTVNGVNGQAYDAVAGTVSGTTVPIASIAGGTSLPIATSPIIVGIPVSTSFPVTGNNVTCLQAGLPNFPGTPAAGYFVFTDGASQEAVFVPTGPGGGNFVYANGSPIIGTNPLASQTPTTVWMSHSNVNGVVQMSAAALTH